MGIIHELRLTQVTRVTVTHEVGAESKLSKKLND